MFVYVRASALVLALLVVSGALGAPVTSLKQPAESAKVASVLPTGIRPSSDALDYPALPSGLDPILDLSTPTGALEELEASEVAANLEHGLRFVPNRGQWDAEALYHVRGAAYDAWLAAGRLVLDLKGPLRAPISKYDLTKLGQPTPPVKPVAGAIVEISFENADPRAPLVPSQESGDRMNFLVGPREAWALNVPVYQAITVESIYPGIDLVYHADPSGDLKYDFLVQPGADPTQIRMRVSGANQLQIDPDGSLRMDTHGGSYAIDEPVSFQTARNGQTVPVQNRYSVDEDGIVTFELGLYDRTLPLTIDPLIFSTYLGGALEEYAFGTAVDSAGRAYLGGATSGYYFPTTVGAYDTVPNGGSYDGFISRISADGTRLESSTLLGGSDWDAVVGVALDSSGNIFLAGATLSPNFPVSATAQQGTLAGGYDAFAARLDPTGSVLVYSTYIGGVSDDVAMGGIALDPAGNSYVPGFTQSGNFPVTAGAFDTTPNGGGQDAFLVKFDPTMGTRLYSTFLGGGGMDIAFGIAVSPDGAAHLTGITTSGSGFPTTAGAHRITGAGGTDAFVTSFSPSGSALTASTLLGSPGEDYAFAIAVGPTGATNVVGYTNHGSFPATTGAFDTIGNGGNDAFLAQFNGGTLLDATFLGGYGNDGAYAVAVDANDNVTVIGLSQSPNFPTTPFRESEWRGGMDIFVTMFPPSRNQLLYSTLIGGTGNERPGVGSVVMHEGDVYIAGYVTSTNFPVTPGAAQPKFGGTQDALMTRLRPSFVPRGEPFAPESIRGTTPATGFGFKQTLDCGDHPEQAVNIVTGQFVSAICVMDSNSPIGPSAAISLTHRTHLQGSTVAGNDWELSLRRRIEPLANGAVLHDGAGRSDFFQKVGTTFQPPPGFHQELVLGASGYTLKHAGGLSESFDLAGKRTAVTDVAGNAVTFVYDALQRPVKVTDALGRDTTLTYTGLYLTSIADHAGRTTQITYSGEYLTSIRFPTDGSRIPTHQFGYTPQGLLWGTADPDGAIYLVNTYDEKGRVIAESTGFTGEFSTYKLSYESEDATRVTDPNGNTIVWQHYGSGFPVPQSRTTLADRNVRPTQSQESVVTYAFNTDLDLTRVTQPSGRTELLTFDETNVDQRARGNLVELRRAGPGSGLDLVARYTYEPEYQMVRTVQAPNGEGLPPGRYTSTTWYGQDELVHGDLNGDGAIGGSQGQSVRIEYPTIHPGGSSHPSFTGPQSFHETFQYNAKGQLVRHQDASGFVTTRDYYTAAEADATHPAGYLKEERTYRTAASPSLAALSMRSFASGASGFMGPSTLTDPGSATTFTYDAAGNIATITDPLGRVEEQQYDNLRRIVRNVSPAGLETRITYDGTGHVLKEERPNAQQTLAGTFTLDATTPKLTDRYSYDELGRLVSRRLDATRPSGAPSMQPAILEERFAYDLNGNLALHQRHSAVNNTNGNAVTTYIYDEHDRLVSQTTGGRSPLFEVNGANKFIDTTNIDDPFALFLHADPVSPGDHLPDSPPFALLKPYIAVMTEGVAVIGAHSNGHYYFDARSIGTTFTDWRLEVIGVNVLTTQTVPPAIPPTTTVVVGSYGFRHVAYPANDGDSQYWIPIPTGAFHLQGTPYGGFIVRVSFIDAEGIERTSLFSVPANDAYASGDRNLAHVASASPTPAIFAGVIPNQDLSLTGSTLDQVLDQVTAASAGPAARNDFVSLIVPWSADESPALTIMQPTQWNTYGFSVETRDASGQPVPFTHYRMELVGIDAKEIAQVVNNPTALIYPPSALTLYRTGTYGYRDSPWYANDGDASHVVHFPVGPVVQMLNELPPSIALFVRFVIPTTQEDKVGLYSVPANLVSAQSPTLADILDATGTPLLLAPSNSAPAGTGCWAGMTVQACLVPGVTYLEVYRKPTPSAYVVLVLPNALGHVIVDAELASQLAVDMTAVLNLPAALPLNSITATLPPPLQGTATLLTYQTTALLFANPRLDVPLVPSPPDPPSLPAPVRQTRNGAEAATPSGSTNVHIPSHPVPPGRYRMDEQPADESYARSGPASDVGLPSPTDARLSWEWRPENGFKFESSNVQATFTAIRVADGANTWVGRLFVDDIEVAHETTSFPPSSMGVPHEYRMDFGKHALNGGKLRFELESQQTVHWILFDGRGAQSRLEIGNAATTTFHHDADGNHVVTTDARGAPTTHAYDALGRMVSTTSPTGVIRTTRLDADGRIIESTVREPASTGGSNTLLEQRFYAYDDLGRQWRQDTKFFDTASGAGLPDGPLTPGDGNATTLREYDGDGRILRELDDNGNERAWTYNGFGLVATVTDAIGNRVENTYDDAGNLVNATAFDVAADGSPLPPRTTLYEYDALDQLIAETDPVGNVKRFGYDANGEIAWTMDERGNVVRHTYDGQGRPATTSRQLRSGGNSTGAVIGYVNTTQVWNGDGGLALQRDHTGGATKYEYDAHGRLTRTTYADGTRLRHEYDPAGNQVRTIDANGNIIHQEFDRENRVARRSVESGSAGWSNEQSLEYDGLGRPTRATDNNGPGAVDDSELVFAYDSLGRRTLDLQGGQSVLSVFDGVGNLVALTYPNGRVLNRIHDDLNRLVHLEDGFDLASFTYEGATRLHNRTVGIGLVSTWTHDGHQRTATVEHDLPGLGLPFKFQYAYDDSGNRVMEMRHHAPNWSQAATYDSIGRLTSLQRSNLGSLPTVSSPLSGILASQASWDINGANDWTGVTTTIDGDVYMESRVHSATHAVESRTINGDLIDHDFDAAGNRVQDGAHNYTWDAFNRLREVHDAGTGDLLASYTYDALNRRVTKDVAGTQTRFVYDGNNVIEEQNATGVLLRQFVHGNLVDQPVLMDRNVDGDDSAAGTADERLFYFQDALGSVVALADEGGNIREAYLYEAYGAVVVVQPGSDGLLDWSTGDIIATDSALENPYTFTGQRFDHETGLYYYRARYMDPVAGQFLNRDPIGIWGDELNLGNPYTYVANNPLLYTDPTGEWIHFLVGAAVGCVVGVGMSAWKNPGSWKNMARAKKAAKACGVGAIAGTATMLGGSSGLAAGGAAFGILETYTDPRGHDFDDYAKSAFWGGAIGLAGGHIIGRVARTFTPGLSSYLDDLIAKAKPGTGARVLDSPFAVQGHGSGAGTTVLGRYTTPPGVPNYIDVGRANGYRYLQAGSTEVTKAMEDKFLEATIARGDRIFLSSSPDDVAGSTWYRYELNYLRDRGYTAHEVPGGWEMKR